MDPKIESVKAKIGGLQSSLSAIADSSKGSKKTTSFAEGQLAFIVGQLESLRSELDNLDKTIVLGAPLTEYSENVEKLDTIEETVNALESKLELTIEKIAEIRKDQETLKSLLQEGISEKQVQLLESRIKNIEELQEKLMSSKSTKIMVELVQIIDELNNRLKRIEELFKISKLGETEVPYAMQFPQPQTIPQAAKPAEEPAGFGKIVNVFKKYF